MSADKSKYTNLRNILCPLVSCSSELTVAPNFNAVDSTLHLVTAGYIGTFTSSLSVDKNGHSWWENGDKAIWWQNGAWNFGPLSEMGPNEVNEGFLFLKYF